MRGISFIAKAVLRNNPRHVEPWRWRGPQRLRLPLVRGGLRPFAAMMLKLHGGEKFWSNGVGGLIQRRRTVFDKHNFSRMGSKQVCKNSLTCKPLGLNSLTAKLLHT